MILIRIVCELSVLMVDGSVLENLGTCVYFIKILSIGCTFLYPISKYSLLITLSPKHTRCNTIIVKTINSTLLLHTLLMILIRIVCELSVLMVDGSVLENLGTCVYFIKILSIGCTFLYPISKYSLLITLSPKHTRCNTIIVKTINSTLLLHTLLMILIRIVCELSVHLVDGSVLENLGTCVYLIKILSIGCTFLYPISKYSLLITLSPKHTRCNTIIVKTINSTLLLHTLLMILIRIVCELSVLMVDGSVLENLGTCGYLIKILSLGCTILYPISKYSLLITLSPKHTRYNTIVVQNHKFYITFAYIVNDIN